MNGGSCGDWRCGWLITAALSAVASISWKYIICDIRRAELKRWMIWKSSVVSATN
jgi:hypothetical protein